MISTEVEIADDQYHWKDQHAFLFKWGVPSFPSNKLSSLLHNKLGSDFYSETIFCIKISKPQYLKLTSKIPTNLPNVPFTPAYEKFKEKKNHTLTTGQYLFPYLLRRSSSFRTGSKCCKILLIWKQQEKSHKHITNSNHTCIPRNFFFFFYIETIFYLIWRKKLFIELLIAYQYNLNDQNLL